MRRKETEPGELGADASVQFPVLPVPVFRFFSGKRREAWVTRPNVGNCSSISAYIASVVRSFGWGIR